MAVAIQEAPFDAGAELNRLTARLGGRAGAVVSFTGLVRDYARKPGAGPEPEPESGPEPGPEPGPESEPSSETEPTLALELEHYPGMTERALADLAAAATRRWDLAAVEIRHRVGRLELGAPIVLVLTAAAHRGPAFAAAEFLMDRLKTDAPFWKCEITPSGRRWVAARARDAAAARRWASEG